MAQITVYRQTAGGNWDSADGWNDAADGSGVNYTNPQNGVNTFICDMNGKAISLNIDVTVDRVQALTSGTVERLTISSTRSLTAATKYAGSSITLGFIAVSTNGVLTYSGNVDGTGATGAMFRLSAATSVLNWIDSSAVSGNCYIIGVNGTVNLGTEANPLPIALSGSLSVVNAGSVTIDATYCTVTYQSATAQCSRSGGLLTTVGPTLPAAGNVRQNSGTFGYAGDPQTPAWSGGLYAGLL